MEIKNEVLVASRDFFALVTEFASVVGFNRFLDKKTLTSIDKALQGFRVIDDFYQSLSSKGALQDFYTFAQENSKNDAIWSLYVSQFQAYRLHYLLWESVKKGAVSDLEFAREILMKGKISNLIGNGEISSIFMSAISNSRFAKMDQNGSIANPDDVGQKIFDEISKESSEFKTYANSVMTVMNRTSSLLDHLSGTDSIIVAFDKKSDGIYEVNIMFAEADDEKLIQVVTSVLGGCYNVGGGLILLGTINETLISGSPSKNSEILANLFKVITQFKKVYIANTDSLLTNNFLATVDQSEKISAGIYEPESKKYS